MSIGQINHFKVQHNQTKARQILCFFRRERLKTDFLKRQAKAAIKKSFQPKASLRPLSVGSFY
ncbi:MAG: hypothetical protein ACLT1K_12830 [[Clostridium] leptum]